MRSAASRRCGRAMPQSSAGAGPAAVVPATEWILPAKQARSRQTRDRLLEAGRQVLEDGDFDATPVAEIARRAGCSVGAFYVRFQDKEAFYRALIERITATALDLMRREVTAARLAPLSREAAVALCVEAWVALFRTHRGLLVTATRRSLGQPDSWNPVRRIGLEMIDHLATLLTAHCGRAGDASFRYRAFVGFHIATGTLLNAVIRQPVVLGLDTPDLSLWMTEVVRHALFGEIPAALAPLGFPAAVSEALSAAAPAGERLPAPAAT